MYFSFPQLLGKLMVFPDLFRQRAEDGNTDAEGVFGVDAEASHPGGVFGVSVFFELFNCRLKVHETIISLFD